MIKTYKINATGKTPDQLRKVIEHVKKDMHKRGYYCFGVAVESTPKGKVYVTLKFTK